MPSFRAALPQLQQPLFLTDGGIETTLIYRDGLDLPHFAAFTLLDTKLGQESLLRAYAAYAALAQRYRIGCVLETPTWRASTDWGSKLGYDPDALHQANKNAVDLLHQIRRQYQNDATPVVISGNLGPRGDAYRPETTMTADEARSYHAPQIAALCDADVDLVTAMTLTYPEEAVGLAQAAAAAGVPVVISFTVETDGRLPNGIPLGDAIAKVDESTGCSPAYYMINCAHPTHFEHVLNPDAPWIARVRGLRANASTKSHAELDSATALDDGNPGELGLQYRQLRSRLPHVSILGGCCGTDERHVEAIFRACLDNLPE